jgi:hypothetical protein
LCERLFERRALRPVVVKKRAVRIEQQPAVMGDWLAGPGGGLGCFCFHDSCRDYG